MVKKQKEQPKVLTFEDKEYEINSLSVEQLAYANHLTDIQNKQATNQFIAEQLAMSHKGFSDLLRESFNSAE